MYWIVVVATLIGVVLSAAIGANDVGNSFATCVGSGVLSIRQAVFIASVCEFSGSMLMGAYVSETLRTGIISNFLSVFTPGVDEQLYMMGTMCVLLGSTIWLCAATFLNMPVSTTHSVVGSIVGFIVTYKGYSAIKWDSIGYIALSWIISPLLGLLLTGPFSLVLSKWVILSNEPSSDDPDVDNQLKEQHSRNTLNRTLVVLPFIVGGTVAVLSSTIFVKGSKALYLDRIPWYAGLSGSVGLGVIVGIVIALFIPMIRRRMLLRYTTSSEHNVTTSQTTIDQKLWLPESDTSNVLDDDQSIYDEIDLVGKAPRTKGGTPSDRVFSILQILCSALTSFSHGANDVSNAIGPLSAIYMVYSAGSVEEALKATMPWYILALGAGGIVLGLALFGQRVIETVGVKLTKNQLRPHQGFVSQLCGASIVMLCSKFGLPVSTTNSIVGAVVGVGLMDKSGSVKRDGEDEAHASTTGSVSWGLLTNIVISWLITLPISAVMTSAFFSFLKWVI